MAPYVSDAPCDDGSATKPSGLLNKLLNLIRMIGGVSSCQDQFGGSFHSLAEVFNE